MILQRDGRLRQEIQHEGCYLMCLLWFLNKFCNFQVEPSSVSDGLFALFLKRGWMTERCKILNPQAILTWGGVDCRYTDRHEPPTRECRADEFEILYWEHPEVGGHFTAGNGAGIVTYDPWGVSRAATEGTLVSKRIFRRV